MLFFKQRFFRASFCLLAAFLGFSFVTRIGLTLFSWHHVVDSPSHLLVSWLVSIPFDFAAGFALTLAWVLLFALIPRAVFHQKGGKIILGTALGVYVYSLVFLSISEFVFWEEFQARLNFLAIDYLTYTHEVIQNIWESYPIVWILLGIALIVVVIVRAFWRTILENLQQGEPKAVRLKTVGFWVVAIVVLMSVLDNRMVRKFHNPFYQEIARNGLFSFAAAWWDQGIRYDQFYMMIDSQEAYRKMRKELVSVNSRLISEKEDSLWRRVENPGPEKRWNVIQITVESLSGSYMAAFGETRNLTPHLDRIAKEGLFFTNLYATGSRTIRGMESLSLSLPPTPGQSVVRRKDNHHYFSLGSLFQGRGYDTVFIYGGRGYFDNMNDFFSGNGFRIHDQTSASEDAITFKNAWGACDEDVFQWSMNEADQVYAQGKPFFQFVMTTSNHRPFTFPEGKVPLPQKTREGGVQYTDFAIAQFLEKAKSKPWFKDTVFVIVADHCAGSSGKTSLPLREYHIPMIVWNPELIPSQTVTKRCSQMDYAPTLAGILNWSYDTLFFGKDILKMTPQEERAFSATYQKLGYHRGEDITLLEPVRKFSQYRVTEPEMSFTPLVDRTPAVEDAISYYQTASDLVLHGLYRTEEYLKSQK